MTSVSSCSPRGRWRCSGAPNGNAGRASLAPQVSTGGGFTASYGYQWWVGEQPMAIGNGGQRSVIDRAARLVLLLSAIGYLVVYAVRHGCKVVYGRSGEITDESLLDGSANPGERLVVVFPPVMAIRLGSFLRMVWRDRPAAERRVAHRAKPGHEA